MEVDIDTVLPSFNQLCNKIIAFYYIFAENEDGSIHNLSPVKKIKNKQSKVPMPTSNLFYNWMAWCKTNVSDFFGLEKKQILISG